MSSKKRMDANEAVVVGDVGATDVAGAIETIPLSALVRSAKNTRKTDPQEAIEELAAMIAAQGLIQNLSVEALPRAKGKPQQYGVIAGGRRLAALQLLVKQKAIAADYPVRCLIVPADRAVEYSFAENQHRAMHPADEFEAFKKLADEKRSADEIAAIFGVEPRHVLRRMKLAELAPEFLALYREGGIALDTLMALANVDSHAKQKELWNSLQKWDRNANGVRRYLEREAWPTSHRMARFVGVAAYEAAGGVVTRDIFSDTDSGFIADTALLAKLANEKIERKADKLRKEGLAFVDVVESNDYTTSQQFTAVRTVLREATKAEAKKLAPLDAKIEELENKLETLYAEGGEDSDEGLQQIEAIEAELSEACKARDAINDAREMPDPNEAAIAGAYVWLTEGGKLETKRNVLRIEDARKLRKGRSREAGAEGDGTASAPKSIHSDALITRLTAHRSLALQAELAARPDVALAALTADLVADCLGQGFGSRGLPWLRIRPEQQRFEATTLRDEPSKAVDALMDRVATLSEGLPIDNAETLFAYLLTVPQEQVMQLLAYCVARCVTVQQQRADSTPEGAALARAVQLDMNAWWRPTGATYLSAIAKPALLAVATENGTAEAEVAKLGKLPKGELVAALETRLADTRWLPEPMREADAAA